MYLLRLYSEPSDLIGPIEFVNGINFIFGKKDKSTDPKNSLNGIGKSVFLDLIDFCLLASFQKNHSPRLYKAKNILAEHKIVLEFEHNGSEYILKRQPDDPSRNIEFGVKGNTRTYTARNLKQRLCDLIFERTNYEGKYDSEWLRKLLPFFVKVQKTNKDSYSDPIRYIKEAQVMELTQYHLFFLGLDNSLAQQNWQIQIDLKEKGPLLTKIKELVRDTYEIDDITDATNEVNKINNEIKNLEKAISNFRLTQQYENAEQKANELTAAIKDLLYENYAAKKRSEHFTGSFQTESDINLRRIQKLYNEFSVLMSATIEKTLNEAIEFRKALALSRKEFLEQELAKLELDIKERETKIAELENERAKIFLFLSAREAIKDLSSAYLALSQKRERLNDLQGRVKLYNDIYSEKVDIEIEERRIARKILSFIDEIQNDVAKFRNIFSEIYNSIYVEERDKSVFAVSYKENTDAKIDINVSFPASDSKGRNQGRTLIYDLAVLFQAIENGFNFPRFLIHDGIFDGMDKAHFVYLKDFLEEQGRKHKFQYIVTLNEEGTLDESFGHVENVTPEKIAEEAILVLTPTNKLFRRDF
ncbi:MAG: DUF2326 domain-containing protein [Planctomycetaceae bacterium]|nr:DUF2326 domain-containing protein [Planctomycetaceae bacterium]